MKENARFFPPSVLVNKIARFCLWAWVFVLFAHGCTAADFGNQELIYTDEPIKVFDHYPPVAQGHEEIYDRFLNGKLIYRPNPGSDEGKVELRIADLADPLEGTFDLSRCGDMEKHLSISTGYRKGKRLENARKVEIWFAPRFLIEKELNDAASHFAPIMRNWKQEALVGIFWTWGGWDHLADYDYLTTETMDDLSKINLYENGKKAACSVGGRSWVDVGWHGRETRCFHVHFMNAT